MQWGYAGLFNVGVAGFFALGGLAFALVSEPFDAKAWAAGTPGILLALALLAIVFYAAILVYRALRPGWGRIITSSVLVIAGLIAFRLIFGPAAQAVEQITPATSGNIGGLGLPVPISLLVGGLFAAAVAWGVAKIALGLRSDYLAIATLGIGQIVIAVLMNEARLDRGVKDIFGVSRWPVPEEVHLQQQPWLIGLAHAVGAGVT